MATPEQMASLAESLSAVNRFHDALSPRLDALVDLFAAQPRTSAEQVRAVFDTAEHAAFNFAFWSRGKCNDTAEQFRRDAVAALCEGCYARALSNVNSAILWADRAADRHYDPGTATQPTVFAALHEFRAGIMEKMGR